MAGDIVVIRPGEGIPVDGVVTEGHGYVDQAAITGESIPVEKNPGDQVISATINKKRHLSVPGLQGGGGHHPLPNHPPGGRGQQLQGAHRPAGGQGQRRVRAGGHRHSHCDGIVWLIAGMGFEFALSNAISVLVISCPCALGLATPVAIMVGTGKAAEMGILIKSAESLENLHNVDTIVLDKTGTITSGHPAVTDVLPLDRSLTEGQFLAEAAAAEFGSEHPLAQAVWSAPSSWGCLFQKRKLLRRCGAAASGPR